MRSRHLAGRGREVVGTARAKALGGGHLVQSQDGKAAGGAGPEGKSGRKRLKK